MENYKMDISIIMPAFNEEKNIPHAINNTLKALDDFKINGEIIVVNDGSTDKTEELLKSAMKKEKRIRLIYHDITQGVGASFWDGVDNAIGEIVLMLPGDNENDPWEILRYWKILEHVDIVIPYVYNTEVRPLYRNIISYIYREIINTTFITNLNYSNGTVLYRKCILNEIKFRNSDYFFQTDLLIRLVKKGFLFAEVPYRLGIRSAGISKAFTFPSLFKVIKGYIKLVRDIYYKKARKAKGKYPEDTLTLKRKKEKR